MNYTDKKLKTIDNDNSKTESIFLKYEATIINNIDNKGLNDIFEVFTSIIDHKPYIVLPDSHSHNISILSLDNCNLICNLFGHKTYILSVRYFVNKSEKKEYLISSSKDNNVIIWDLIIKTIINKIRINSENDIHIFSNLLAFNIYDLDYIIISIDGKECSRIYNFYDTKNYNEFKNTLNDNSFYSLLWHNSNDNNYYIIECCQGKITLNNLIDSNEEQIKLISPNSKISFHFNAIIYTKNNLDFLCATSNNGFINIWDLYNKSIYKSIFLNGNELFNIIKWNEKYFIVSDKKNCFIIIDIIQNKMIFQKRGSLNMGGICIKKIFVQKYGEVLITSEFDKSVKLWKNENKFNLISSDDVF